jgi:hypothetical protein
MSVLLSYLPLRNQALFARLFQEAAEAVAKNFEASPLQEGKPLIAALPHSDGKADLVEIGGSFFYGKEDAVVNAPIVLVGLLAADRPLCSPRKFVLNIESPDRVRWAVEVGGKEIEGGPEPLNQALIRMSCAGEEEVPGNLLPHIPVVVKELQSWEVERLRSCCLGLAHGRYDHLLKITVSLAKEGTILVIGKGEGAPVSLLMVHSPDLLEESRRRCSTPAGWPHTFGSAWSNSRTSAARKRRTERWRCRCGTRRTSKPCW